MQTTFLIVCSIIVLLDNLNAKPVIWNAKCKFKIVSKNLEDL